MKVLYIRSWINRYTNRYIYRKVYEVLCTVIVMMITDLGNSDLIIQGVGRWALGVAFAATALISWLYKTWELCHSVNLR